MKNYLIRKYFSQAYKRLQRVGCVTSEDEPVFDSIMNELECFNAEGDIERLAERFSNQLDAIQEWVGNIYPEDPDAGDKKTLKSFDKVVDFCIDRLEKIGKLCELSYNAQKHETRIYEVI